MFLLGHQTPDMIPHDALLVLSGVVVGFVIGSVAVFFPKKSKK